MKEFESLFDAINNLEDIFYDIRYSLDEGEILRKIFKDHLTEMTIEEKSWVQFDSKQLLLKINNYRNALKHYRLNYNEYDRTNTIQENDVKITTFKFFTDVVAPLRKNAITSLKELNRIIQNTKSLDEKENLNIVKVSLIKSTNELMDVCITVIETNRKNLIENLKRKGIDFKISFNLIHIDPEEV